MSRSRAAVVIGAEPLAETSRALPQQPLRAINGTVQPLSVADALALPALNGPETICRLWDFTRSQFHRLNKQGAFDFLKVEPAVGPRCFSGILIARYLCKEPLRALTFGGKRQR